MRDMVNITQKSKKVLKSTNCDQLYASLGCDITHVNPASDEYKRVTEQVLDSQKKSHGNIVVNIKNVFKV